MRTARAVRLALLLCSFVPIAGGAADTAQPSSTTPARPRDAAEAVQEGSVTQWLEHYQRERGAEWAKSRPEAQNPPEKPAAPAGSADPAAPAK